MLCKIKKSFMLKCHSRLKCHSVLSVPFPPNFEENCFINFCQAVDYESKKN